MPSPFTKQLTAWSFSRWSVYDLCPAQAKYKFIDKIPEPQGPALARGDAIHKAAERYIKEEGRAPKLIPELKKVAPILKELRKAYKTDPATTTIEATWAFRSNWTQTTWNDWNGCWLRVKVDAKYEVEGDDGEKIIRIKDWKSGKFSPQYNVQDYLLQLDLYATGALSLYATGNTKVKVIPQLEYTDAGVTYPPEAEARIYTEKDLKPLQKEWEKRVKPMLADKTFKPKPNSKCGWCSFSKAKGGPCQYGD